MASIGDWVHIRQGVAGRHSRGKESSVILGLRSGREERKKMACAVVLWASRRTILLGKELTRLGVCAGSTIGGTRVAGQHGVTIFLEKTCD